MGGIETRNSAALSQASIALARRSLIIENLDDAQTGKFVQAFSNTTPAPASRSMAGVIEPLLPWALRALTES